MEKFYQRFCLTLKEKSIAVILKTAIIGTIMGYIFGLTPQIVLITATIFCLFIFIQKSLLFTSNQFLFELAYYVAIVFGTVIATILGYMQAEGPTAYFVAVLLAYLLYKIFNTYEIYSFYKSSEKKVLQYVIDQIDADSPISIHAIYKNLFMSKDEIIQTIKAHTIDGKIPDSIQLDE